MSQGVYWILTIQHADFLPYLPPGVAYIIGQLERGHERGYLHWQLMVALSRKQRLAWIKKTFGESCHAELTRSSAAKQYVCKDETRIDGTQFELGTLPFQRNDPKDWDKLRDLAKRGRLDDIPSDVYVRCYNQLRRISADHLAPVAKQRTVTCYWGRTGTGKSRRAWDEAGIDAYPKDPRSKFWDGYRGQTNVVVDEFRGGIDISHILRWLDRYPVIVEVKGSSVPLEAENIWFTSNLAPQDWYPDLDEETKQALRRRMTIIHFN